MDPAEDRAAYREALARAEAAAVSIDEAGRETPATPAIPEELAGAVEVAASDQPLTPEAETPAVAETADAPVVEETPEQLREKLAQAEARLEEQKSMIGRQSAEVGETREVLARMEAELAALKTQSATPATPAPTAAPVTQDMIDEDPARAVITAYEQRDEATFVRAFNAWKDPFNEKGDPAAAASWLAEQRIAQARAEYEARTAQLEERLEKLTAPVAARNEWEQAFTIVRQEHPEFIQNAERILSEVAPQYEEFVPMLANGDAKQKAAILKVLYEIDRARTTDPATVKQELETAAAEAAAEEAATRNAAAAVVGQPTAGQSNAPELTPEQQEQKAYTDRWQGRPSLDRGWTGRS